MAGSKDWFKYTSDAGATYAINCDESNWKAVGNGDARPDVNAVGIPSTIKVRYAVYGDSTRKIKIPIETKDKLSGLASAKKTIGNPLGGGDLGLLFIQPEKVKLIPNTDTGLTEGGDTG